MNNRLMIQHEVNQPGVTPWLPSQEDLQATDYVPAYFNSEDTTKRGPIPAELIRQPIRTSPTDCWPFVISAALLAISLISIYS